MAPTAKELGAKEGDILLQITRALYLEAPARLMEIVGFEKRQHRDILWGEETEVLVNVREYIPGVGRALKPEKFSIDENEWRNIIKREDRMDLG